MITKWPPDPTDVLIDLKEFFELFCPSLKAGADHSTKYFDTHFLRDDLSQTDSIDSGLHAHMTRHYASKLADDAGINGLGWNHHQVSNSGLFFTNSEYAIRILKTNSGKLPDPRNSRARREYYYQPMMFLGTPFYTIPAQLKLVLLWDIDSRYQINNLSLACPRNFDRSSATVSAHWYVPLPEFGSWDIVEDMNKNVVSETYDDLPMRPKRREATGTDNNEDV